MSSASDPGIACALANDLVIDITTIGRSSGEPKRLEIWFHNVDDRYYITGRPGPRSWYANVVANPAITFHFKESTQADLDGTARPITDPAEKRSVFLSAKKLSEFINEGNVQEWVDGSPLIEVVFD
ncbi:MAG: nitroreductase/quinone reductase family protein [Chloroflexi bacterium]|nr:nitroreductase/quinone reductase family protein [Chloroflexota bacterium]